MSTKTWIIFAVLCVAILGGLVYLSTGNRLDVSDVDTAAVQPASERSGNIGDQVFGNREANVVLVEYGDFQCPGCAGVYGHVKTALQGYEDDVAFVYRHFPLTSIHPNARSAAAAAEAAGKQGQFWEMHDILFENQAAWGNISASERQSVFTGYAQQLTLDLEQFVSDFSDNAILQKINFDQALGSQDGATSTPTFVLNGERVSDDVRSALSQGNIEPLQNLFDELLAE